MYGWTFTSFVSTVDYPGVLQVGLAGDHLGVITENDHPSNPLKYTLNQHGIQVTHLEMLEVSLEDVFLALSQ